MSERDLLEPECRGSMRMSARDDHIYSIAISLKRIADDLEYFIYAKDGKRE